MGTEAFAQGTGRMPDRSRDPRPTRRPAAFRIDDLSPVQQACLWTWIGLVASPLMLLLPLYLLGLLFVRRSDPTWVWAELRERPNAKWCALGLLLPYFVWFYTAAGR